MVTADDRQPSLLERLRPPECWALLETRSIGRLAVARRGLGPLVVPVSYVIDGNRDLVFRTAAGTKVDALLVERASFQVDELDPLHRTGWSVLVEGTATVRWAQAADPMPAWAPGLLPFLVTLTPEHVSGRSLRLDLLDTDARGYR